jgi:integrase
VASVDKRPDGRYRARWREYPSGRQRTKTFARKRDAELFLADVQHRLLAGTYTPPEAGRITLAAYAEEWLRRRHWAESTAEGVERMLRLRILPELGRWPLAGLRRSHIEQWAAGLPLAPSSVRTLHRTLSSLLGSAVEDERIPRNPAARARLPKVDDQQVVPLTIDEVRALTTAMVVHVRAAVVVAAGTGLRQGELFGLTVDRVDFLRRELRVDRQLWSPRTGRPIFVAPKSKASRRTIALSPVVVDAMAAHLAAFGPGDDGVVFHTMRGTLISPVLGGDYIRSAVKRAGLSRITWHSLRHYHASTLLSSGVSPALVAERLGHDIQTLMHTYAHVVRADDERVRAIVDEHLAPPAEDFLRTRPPRGVPYIGPDLRERPGITSTPRSNRGDPVTCGFALKWRLAWRKTYML